MGSESSDGRSTSATRKLAGAPISWGVCEVPGWGRMLPPERVLGEMSSLGLRATELGPIGYLPLDAARLRSELDRHGLELVAGFVPLVLHERSLERTREAAGRIARVLAGAGAEVFVAAAVMDADWSAPVMLGNRERRLVLENLAAIEELVDGHGLTFALHPHAGTLVETAAEIERILAGSAVRLCLDTGHSVIAGLDPAELIRRHGERIVHVHLKDVDAELAARVRSGERSLVEATRQGLFRPLGRGDAEIDEVVGLLDRYGYERWLVLEQDTAITGEEPAPGQGPMIDVQESIAYLGALSPNPRGGVPQS